RVTLTSRFAGAGLAMTQLCQPAPAVFLSAARLGFSHEAVRVVCIVDNRADNHATVINRIGARSVHSGIVPISNFVWGEFARSHRPTPNYIAPSNDLILIVDSEQHYVWLAEMKLPPIQQKAFHDIAVVTIPGVIPRYDSAVVNAEGDGDVAIGYIQRS